MSRLDISGQQLGKLFVIQKIKIFKQKSGKSMSLYRCVCDCGNFTNKDIAFLRKAVNKTCDTCTPHRARRGNHDN